MHSLAVDGGRLCEAVHLLPHLTIACSAVELPSLVHVAATSHRVSSFKYSTGAMRSVKMLQPMYYSDAQSIEGHLNWYQFKWLPSYGVPWMPVGRPIRRVLQRRGQPGGLQRARGLHALVQEPAAIGRTPFQVGAVFVV